MQELADERFYEDHADFCAVFSNANRLKLLDLMADGEEHTVSELEAASGISQSTISQHLRLMRDQGIVRRKRVGVHNYYSLTDERLVGAMDTIRQVFGDRRES